MVTTQQKEAMPINFMVSEDRRVSWMSNNRARAFAGITNGIAEAFDKPRPIIFDGLDYVIDEEKFCALVEFAFQEEPLNMMFSWAEWACGIYQSIKGELYEWHWPGTERPTNCVGSPTSTLFKAVNISDFWPPQHSGKKIEPPPHK